MIQVGRDFAINNFIKYPFAILSVGFANIRVSKSPCKIRAIVINSFHSFFLLNIYKK